MKKTQACSLMRGCQICHSHSSIDVEFIFIFLWDYMKKTKTNYYFGLTFKINA
jgi:hypothetical protein